MKRMLFAFILAAVLYFLKSNTETQVQPQPTPAPTTEKDSSISRYSIIKPFRKVESW